MKLVTALALAVLLQTGGDKPAANAQTRNCLHGSAEAPLDKTRRDAAIKVARAVGDAETKAKTGGKYQPLGTLGTLPDMPTGFRLQLTTDGATYVFSLKDGLDLCGFAIFSDQQGFLYEGSPINRPGIRLLTGS